MHLELFWPLLNQAERIRRELTALGGLEHLGIEAGERSHRIPGSPSFVTMSTVYALAVSPSGTADASHGAGCRAKSSALAACSSAVLKRGKLQC